MVCENCEVFRRELRAREKEVESLWLALKDEMKRTMPLELLRVASEAAQIAKLSANAFPEWGSVADEAAAVALAALKQVRKGLDGEERPEPAEPKNYDVIVDVTYPGEEGSEFRTSPTHSFKLYRSLGAAVLDMNLEGKSIYVASDEGCSCDTQPG